MLLLWIISRDESKQLSCRKLVASAQHVIKSLEAAFRTRSPNVIRSDTGVSTQSMVPNGRPLWIAKRPPVWMKDDVHLYKLINNIIPLFPL